MGPSGWQLPAVYLLFLLRNRSQWYCNIHKGWRTLSLSLFLTGPCTHMRMTAMIWHWQHQEVSLFFYVINPVQEFNLPPNVTSCCYSFYVLMKMAAHKHVKIMRGDGYNLQTCSCISDELCRFCCCFIIFHPSSLSPDCYRAIRELDSLLLQLMTRCMIITV